MDYYDLQTLEGIIQRTCQIINVPFTEDGATEIAKRARGTPRIANNLINFCRDYAMQKSDGVITQEQANLALELLEIDHRGLDELDKKVLRIIADNYKGGPVGLRTLAVAVGEEAHTLEEVHEPFLIQEGFLMRTPRGRKATEKSYKHLGIDMGFSQGGLF